MIAVQQDLFNGASAIRVVLLRAVGLGKNYFLDAMKITLDHNVILDLEHGSAKVARLRELLIAEQHQIFVVKIGASEMQKYGVEPGRYDLFEQLLDRAGIGLLPRLTPMLIWDVTFWGHSMWAGKGMVELADAIEDILFGGSPPIDITSQPKGSRNAAKWLNRLCDVHTMWCHLHYANDIFVTSDLNFHKETKLPRLLAFGAGKICKPEDL